MTQRRHLTLVATGATLLAALPLATIFQQWTWFVDVFIVVFMMTGAAVGLRSVRTPVWAPTITMIIAYLVGLTWLFSDGRAALGVLPTPATLSRFNALLTDAGGAIREKGVPVSDSDGLLFLATLGIGAVLLMVDLTAVIARRPALAGVPIVAIYMVAVGTHSASVSIVSFLCTAASFLWLLATDNVDKVRRFGRRFTGDGRDIDVWEPSPLAAAGRRLAVVGVAAAVLLPLAIPGMTTGLLNRFGTGSGGSGGSGGGGSGRQGAVNLFSFLSGSLVRDRTYNMVKVSTNDPNPFYLRFGVAEDLTTNGFVSRNWGPGTTLSSLNTLPIPDNPGVVSHNFRADIEILDFSMPLLPVYTQPTRVQKLDNSWQWDRRASVLYSSRSTSKGKKYTIDYVRSDLTPEVLRTALPLSGDDTTQIQFTRVPDIKLVREQAVELAKGKATPYDRVRAIYDFFTDPDSGFRYELQTESGNSGSQMVDFLTNRVGFCEQYAAAMGWLVRAIGIPARVAFGWTRGTNTKGTQYTLSNFNLHAWTEVYFNGFGWVPFDATPSTAISGAVSTAWAPDPNLPPGSTGGREDPDDFSVDPSSSAGAAQAGPDQRHPDDMGAIGEPGGDTGSALLPPLVFVSALLLVLVLLCLPAVRRLVLRRRRWPSVIAGPPMAVSRVGPGTLEPDTETMYGRARHEAHLAWAELVDTMIDFRVPVNPAETPRATADRLTRERGLVGASADGMRLLSYAEERARYAREPRTDVTLAPALQSVCRALRKRVSTRTRLLAVFFPRSVLNRWRTRFATRYATVVTSVGRRQYLIGQRLSPRRLLAARAANRAAEAAALRR